MLMNQTTNKLNALKLNAMARALDLQRANPQLQELPFEDRFAMLVDHETQARDTRRVGRLLKNAQLKVPGAALEDIDFRATRNLDKAVISSLMSLEWIRRGHNLILTGPCGAGKTWLACAFANAAARNGMPTQYFRAPRLLEELYIAREAGSLLKLRRQLAKIKLLLLDDWGVATMTPQGRQDLFEVIDDRTNLSTVITAQLPVASWHAYIGDPTIADAILDRIVHRAHKIEIKGDSMRKLQGDLPID
ncbi:MAG: IS21-like element helper ATPase IstB [Sulfuricaulis sp.]